MVRDVAMRRPPRRTGSGRWGRPLASGRPSHRNLARGPRHPDDHGSRDGGRGWPRSSCCSSGTSCCSWVSAPRRRRRSRTRSSSPDEGGQRRHRPDRRPGRERHVRAARRMAARIGCSGCVGCPRRHPSGSGSTPSASFTSFTTVVPPDGDPSLLPLLETHGVVVSAVDRTARGSLLSTVVGLAAQPLARRAPPRVLRLLRPASAAQPVRDPRDRPVECAALQRGTSERHVRRRRRRGRGEDRAHWRSWISCATPPAIRSSGHACRAACCSSGRRAPARPCSRAPWPAKPASRSTASPRRSSWSCSSAWAPRACATCSSVPRRPHRRSSSSTRSMRSDDNAGRAGRRQRRARADPQPAARRDGRLRRLDQRHRHRGHEPPRRARPGAASARAASTARSPSAIRIARVARRSSGSTREDPVGGRRRPRDDRTADARFRRRRPGQSRERGRAAGGPEGSGDRRTRRVRGEPGQDPPGHTSARADPPRSGGSSPTTKAATRSSRS